MSVFHVRARDIYLGGAIYGWRAELFSKRGRRSFPSVHARINKWRLFYERIKGGEPSNADLCHGSARDGVPSSGIKNDNASILPRIYPVYLNRDQISRPIHGNNHIDTIIINFIRRSPNLATANRMQEYHHASRLDKELIIKTDAIDPRINRWIIINLLSNNFLTISNRTSKYPPTNETSRIVASESRT